MLRDLEGLIDGSAPVSMATFDGRTSPGKIAGTGRPMPSLGVPPVSMGMTMKKDSDPTASTNATGRPCDRSGERRSSTNGKNSILSAATAAGEVSTSKPARLIVRYETSADGSDVNIGPDHADRDSWIEQLQDAFGSPGLEFPSAQLHLLARSCRIKDGRTDAVRLNALVAVVDGARPSNEIEAMVAVQMALSHGLVVDLLHRAHRAEAISQFDSAGNMAAKLLRAFAGHAELLQKLKRGGEQTVRVEHVHVNAGGQAIVGKFVAGGKGLK